MSNIDKQALRERYSEKPAPKCHICGSVMTIQRAGAGSVVYGCTGRIDKDGEGYKFAEGRDFADDHYARSRVTDYGPGGDPDVLALLDELEAKNVQIANLAAERDALREGEMGDAKHSNTRAAADIYFQLVEECEIPAGGSLVEYVSELRERAAMLQGAEQPQNQQQNIPENIPVNTPCKEAPEHIWLQTAGVWPENGEFSELTWCSDNQHTDDTLYVRADVVSGNSPVLPDGLRLALSNAGIAAPESDEMLAATCDKHIQELVTWVKERKPFSSPVIPDGVCPRCGRKPLKNKTCSVAGCDGKHVARGFCEKHYAIERKKDPSRRESIRAADKRYRARKAAALQQEVK